MQKLNNTGLPQFEGYSSTEMFAIIENVLPSLPTNPYPSEIDDPDWDGITPATCPKIENPDKRLNQKILLLNMRQNTK